MKQLLRLRGPFAIYGLIAGIVSICQADCINADFVAYATVGHRVLESPATSVTGSWSPLFSWLMAPLYLLGIGDLISGRIILLASGFCYIMAVDELARKFFSGNTFTERMLLRGLQTCATIQAIWFSNYLLNPDLLACALVFWYFAQMLDPRTGLGAMRAGLAGGTLGLAYLAKAYMLPFGIVQLLVICCSHWLFRSRFAVTAQPPMRAVPLLAFVIGLIAIAGPWIAVLSQKYERFSYTNAGRANHANVGPGSFGKDPLWHPPLTPDYILEPVIAPEWSPLANIENLRHQIFLILHNSSNCVGLIPGWLALAGLALATWWRHRRACKTPAGQLSVWALLTATVYCSGYLTVNLEARYIIPVVAPLLCLAAADLLYGLVHDAVLCTTDRFRPAAAGFSPRGEWRFTAIAIFTVATFGIVDLYSIVCVAVYHPQSVSMSTYRTIARQLDEAGIADQPTASNHWHDGLYIAYARGKVSSYLGAPQTVEDSSPEDELLTKGVRLHLRWITDEPGGRSTEIPEAIIAGFWNHRLTITDPMRANRKVEVYLR